MRKYVYNGENIEVIFDTYTNNKNTAVILRTEDFGWMTISTNIRRLDPGLFAVDTNNHPKAETFLVDNNIAEPTGDLLRSGFCIYPVYKIRTDGSND